MAFSYNSTALNLATGYLIQNINVCKSVIKKGMHRMNQSRIISH